VLVGHRGIFIIYNSWSMAYGV